MAIIRLKPITYSVSSSTLTVSNAANMYNNTDNTTYATATHTQKGTTAYYLYLKGFNFGDIPANATIKSFTIKVKAYEKSLSTNTTYRPYLCNNTTTITGNCNTIGTSVQTLEFTGVTASFDTIKGYGSNFGIRLCVRRNQQNTQGYLYVYGAEIEVVYLVPGETALYVKENGTWEEYSKGYKKVSGSWVEQDITTLFNTGTKYVKKT